jgi:hypothetical protein
VTDPSKQLENLEDAMVEDILSLSDEEVMAEAREDDLLSEWNLMAYGYTYPHWNRRAERQ